jgi:hypothetical protein
MADRQSDRYCAPPPGKMRTMGKEDSMECKNANILAKPSTKMAGSNSALLMYIHLLKLPLEYFSCLLGVTH